MGPVHRRVSWSWSRWPSQWMVGMPTSEARRSYARIPGCVQRACLVVSRSWWPSPVGSGASSRRERAAWSKGEVGAGETRDGAGRIEDDQAEVQAADDGGQVVQVLGESVGAGVGQIT